MPSSRRREIIETLLIAIAIVGMALLLWFLRGLLILVFGAILLAVILRIIARPFKERLGLPDKLALLVAVALVAGVFALAFVLFGQEVAGQWDTLRQSIPSAWQGVLQRLEGYGFAEPMRQWLQSVGSGGQGVVSSMTRFLVSFTNAIVDTLLVIFGGIYLAADPSLYRRGIAKLRRAGQGHRHYCRASTDHCVCWRSGCVASRPATWMAIRPPSTGTTRTSLNPSSSIMRFTPDAPG